MCFNAEVLKLRDYDMSVYESHAHKRCHLVNVYSVRPVSRTCLLYLARSVALFSFCTKAQASLTKL